MSSTPLKAKKSRKRGYIVIATALSVFVLLGMLGLAIDLGRMYIVKSEAQAFADSAAIAAAIKLDGKKSGLDAAEATVQNSLNRVQFNSATIPLNQIQVEFANNPNGPWETQPINQPRGYGFVRVTVRPSVSMSFLRAVNAPVASTVLGRAVGAQIQETFPRGGYMPFSPYALQENDPTGNFGMTVGQEYAFLWPGNVKRNDACAGNQVNWPQYNFSDQSVAGSERGYFELQAASSIQDAILGAKQTMSLDVGDIVPMTNGQKQSQQSSLQQRAFMDTDLTNYSPTPGVAPPYYGNNMRLVVMPVNGGPVSIPPNKVLGFAAFLLPLQYPNGGNKTWCAIYMGSRTAGGGSSAYDGGGSYVVRLVQ